jgi:hypothetical protein
MSSWGITDNAANSPLWAAASLKVEGSTSNRTALFETLLLVPLLQVLRMVYSIMQTTKHNQVLSHMSVGI